MRNIILQIYDFAVSYLVYTDWDRILIIVQIISGVASIFLLISIIQVLSRIRASAVEPLSEEMEELEEKQAEEMKEQNQKRWDKINDQVQNGSENDFKIAIVEADKMFDESIKKLGYLGDDMGERLKKITPVELPNIEDIWWAHKIRNRIAHETDFKLEERHTKRAISIYKEALMHLKFI